VIGSSSKKLVEGGLTPGACVAALGGGLEAGPGAPCDEDDLTWDGKEELVGEKGDCNSAGPWTDGFSEVILLVLGGGGSAGDGGAGACICGRFRGFDISSGKSYGDLYPPLD
jgi:hypothetical protein